MNSCSLQVSSWRRKRVPPESTSIIILEDYANHVNLFHLSCPHLYFVSTSERLSETKKLLITLHSNNSDQLLPTSDQGHLNMKWAVDGRSSMHLKSSVRDVSCAQASKEPRSVILKGTPRMLIDAISSSHFCLVDYSMPLCHMYIPFL